MLYIVSKKHIRLCNIETKRKESWRPIQVHALGGKMKFYFIFYFCKAVKWNGNHGIVYHACIWSKADANKVEFIIPPFSDR